MEVVLAVDFGFCDGNVPRRNVELSCGMGAEGGIGVTTKGRSVSSTVPFTSVSYEKPVWTGWSR